MWALDKELLIFPVLKALLHNKALKPIVIAKGQTILGRLYIILFPQFKQNWMAVSSIHLMVVWCLIAKDVNTNKINLYVS